MNRLHNQCVRALLLAGLAGLGACATEQLGGLEKDFGNSVRNMVSAQKYIPQADDPGLDGQQAEKILRAYRQDVASPKEIKNEIVINVGN